jgi:flagellar hook-associated protein 3 FlgL
LDTITDFGVSVTIDGQPASGDAFKVRASESQSVFDTLANTIKLLESGKPIETMGNVQFHNELGAILSSLGRAEDSILSARAMFGSNLSEVDSLDSVGESLNVQFEDTLSTLQDLDYAEAITKLTRQQMELQAAQQSFTKISQLSLFDYIQ